ncbi:MAG: tryptophan--tRNA ligase [Crocinitomicaceae bacterium]|nr:tryptophan--tRNA ligase [Crocinitomicaceae bacterium]
MARILTGIQSTGTPHLGNVLGAIRPAIELAQDTQDESFLFIADLHSLTQIKDGSELRANTYAAAAAWLACGLDTDRTVFYRQSDVPQCTELAWYLSCFFPYNRLTLAHSFKDKSNRLEDVNAGLFSYPMLMAADILAYDANEVPVGKDQLQHLEMARDVAGRINHKVGREILIEPEARTNDATMYVPGTDGAKMSKSKGNLLDPFADEKTLKKVINKQIVTDATPLEEPKDPESSVVYKIYKLVASPEEANAMASKLLAGGYGWGHAKKDLLGALVDGFSQERDTFNRYMADLPALDAELAKGADKARTVANATVNRLRSAFGY